MHISKARTKQLWLKQAAEKAGVMLEQDIDGGPRGPRYSASLRIRPMVSVT